MNNKIVVIGSSNVDFIMKMDRLPQLGETVTNAEFMQTFGGKGANQAVGAARAGGDVWFVSSVGDDLYGPLTRQAITDAGAHVDYVFTATGIATGTALVMVGPDGDNYLSVAPGANYRLMADMLNPLAPLIREASMVVLQYEILPETLYKAITLAADNDTPVMFNLAPIRPLDESYLAKLDYLIVNEVEAAYLCGFPVDTPEHYRQAADFLLAKGAKTVILTLGARGSYVAAADMREYVNAFKVDAVDTTAAGDIYCGSLSVALVEGKPLLDAVRFAGAASAISVTRLGAQPSAPTRTEIDTFLTG